MNQLLSQIFRESLHNIPYISNLHCYFFDMLVMNIVVVQTYSTHVIVVVDDDDDIRHVLLWLVENLIAKVLIRYMNRSYACT